MIIIFLGKSSYFKKKTIIFQENLLILKKTIIIFFGKSSYF